MFWTPYQQPPPYYPPMGGGYPNSSTDDALKVAKAMIKEGRRIKREFEAKKPEEKKDTKKSAWEKLDTLHVFLFMMAVAPIVGLVYKNLLLQLIK